MFIFLKSLLRTLFLPPGGLLILAVLGLLLARRHRRLGGALLIIGLGSLWMCATPVVGDALMRLAERYPPLDPSRPASAQAIVILAGRRGCASPRNTADRRPKAKRSIA